MRLSLHHRQCLPAAPGCRLGWQVTRYACQHRQQALPRQRWRRAAAAAAPPHADSQAPPSAAALAWVERLRSGDAHASLPSGGVAEQVAVHGMSLHLGLEMEWRLAFDCAGSFRESLGSPEMSSSWGYLAPECSSCADSSSSGAGGAAGDSSSSAGASAGKYFSSGGVCWASDDAGCPRQMQLDDEEALLLVTWVRTGAWLLPHIAAQLHVEAAPPPTGSEERSGARARRGAGGESAWLRLRLRRGGRVTTLLQLCLSTGLPHAMHVQLAGDEELWEMSDWRQWGPGLWLAAHAVQSTPGEGSVVNTYQVVRLQQGPGAAAEACSSSSDPSADGGSASDGSSVSRGAGGPFAPPPSPMLPADAAFLPDVPADVPALFTASGHSVVQPLLDGRPVGYFIFDTGASGFVLDPAVAEALGLEAFGELQVTSMTGKVASRFRRASSFQLGPLRIERPLLMELPCSGLVAGLPGGATVAGIVGHDVLRRALVHMPAHPRRAAAQAAVDGEVDSPAAAMAASMAAAKSKHTPLPFMLRLEHPGMGEGGSCAAHGSSAAAAGPGSSGAASQATATAAAAARTAEPLAADGAQVASSLSIPSTADDQQQQREPAAATSPSVGQDLQWLPLVMVAGLPHVELELVSCSGQRFTGLFMLDSGAGGFDVIVNSEPAASLGLAQGSGGTHIRGIGGLASERLSARQCQLAEARLGPAVLHGVTATFREGGGGGLVLSRHTSGIACAGLLGRCSLLYDYARMRLAVLDATADG